MVFFAMHSPCLSCVPPDFLRPETQHVFVKDREISASTMQGDESYYALEQHSNSKKRKLLSQTNSNEGKWQLKPPPPSSSITVSSLNSSVSTASLQNSEKSLSTLSNLVQREGHIGYSNERSCSGRNVEGQLRVNTESDDLGPRNTSDELGAANASTSVTENLGPHTVNGSWNCMTGADSSHIFIPVKKEEDAEEAGERELPPCPSFKMPHCPVCDCAFDTDVTLRQRNYSDMRNQHRLPVQCHKCSQVECYRCVATRMANLWDTTNDVSRKVKHLACALCGDPCGHYLDTEPMTVHPELFNALARDDAIATARVASGNRGNAIGANANRANANRRGRRRTQTAQRAAAAAAAAALSAASSQKSKKDDAVTRPDRLLVCLPLVNVIRDINEYLPVINEAFKAATGRSLIASPDASPTPGSSSNNFDANAQIPAAPSPPQDAARARSPGNSSSSPSRDGDDNERPDDDDERPDDGRKRPYVSSPVARATATDRTEPERRIYRSRRTPTRLVEELAAKQQVRGLNRLVAAAASAAETVDDRTTVGGGRGGRGAVNAFSPRLSPSQYSSPLAQARTERPNVQRQSGRGAQPLDGRRSTDVEAASTAQGGANGSDLLDPLINDASQPQILVEGSLRSNSRVRTRLEQGRCRWESQRGSGAADVAVFRAEEDAFDTWKKAVRAIKHGNLKLRLHLPNDVRGAQELPEWFPSESVVGMKVRKFFPDYDEPFDGRIIRYLGQREDSDDDSDDDENAELWEILFEDGDVEHWNRKEVVFNRQLFVAYLLQTRRALGGNEAVEPEGLASHALPCNEPQRLSPVLDDRRIASSSAQLSTHEVSAPEILDITSSPSIHSHASDATPMQSNRSAARDPSATSEPVENVAATSHRHSPSPPHPSDREQDWGTSPSRTPLPPPRTPQKSPAGASANYPDRSAGRALPRSRSSESSSWSSNVRQQRQPLSPAKRARPQAAARTRTASADTDGGYVPWQGKKGKRKAEARAWKASVVNAKRAKSEEKGDGRSPLAPIVAAGGVYGELDYVTIRDSRRGEISLTPPSRRAPASWIAAANRGAGVASATVERAKGASHAKQDQNPPAS
jgi:hypothetical protein